MDSQLSMQTKRQRFNRRTGFTTGGYLKKFGIGILLLVVGVNLLVILTAKVFSLIGK